MLKFKNIIILLFIISLMFSIVVIAEEIEFQDDNLEKYIRESINKKKGDLYFSDLILIEELIINDRNYLIESFEGIEQLENLKKLELWRSVVNGNISFLKNLTNLEHLNLHSNGIKDISVLSNLTKLKFLDFGDNKVIDIFPIKNLTNLKILKMGGAAEGIPAGGNKFDDLSPIKNLTKLELLTLDYSNVSDLSILENLVNLKELSLYFAEVADISPLVKNNGFGEGDLIDMRYNNLNLNKGSEDMKNINILIDRGVDVKYEPQK